MLKRYSAKHCCCKCAVWQAGAADAAGQGRFRVLHAPELDRVCDMAASCSASDMAASRAKAVSLCSSCSLCLSVLSAL